MNAIQALSQTELYPHISKKIRNKNVQILVSNVNKFTPFVNLHFIRNKDFLFLGNKKKAFCMNKAYLILCAALLGGIIFYACDDSITATQIDNKVIPSSNVSYSEYIQPVFTVKCALSGCHDDRTQAGGLVLTSYGFAIADYTMIAPGNPNNSKVVWAITGNGAPLMPPVGSAVKPLTSNQIAGIKTWIQEGAKNN